MKVMVVWKTVPGKYKTAVDQFLKAGGPVPAGAKTVGRWHTPGDTLGWHLIEATDLASSPSTWPSGLMCWRSTSIRRLTIPKREPPRRKHSERN
jgi:hypothetical protein